MKILIVKTSSIGDVLHSFPVLSYLRRQFPEAQIDWAVEKESVSLLQAHPELNQVLVLDSRAWRMACFAKKTREEVRTFLRLLRKEEYDLLIDLQGNCKSALVTLLARAKEKVGFAWSSLPEKPNWFVTTHRYAPPKNLSVRMRNLYLVQQHLQDLAPFVPAEITLTISPEEAARMEEIVRKTQGAPLMVCFGSKWKNKQLNEETLFFLLKKIEEKFKPSFVFVWGNEKEKRLADRLKLSFPRDSQSVGDMGLNFWQALMRKMRGILAVDSAALHLCATTKTPSFSVFGASSAAYYKPEGSEHLAMQGACPYGQMFEKRCPILRTCATGACMRSQSADALFSAFAPWWTAIEK
ncbi:MAG: lipopolysaccharide heptosyltransferase I [Chlamydiales bacterium]